MPGDRTQNWIDKVIPLRIKEDFEKKLPTMTQLIGGIFDEFIVLEQTVRTILAGESELVIHSPFYQAAAKQFWKAHRHWAGGHQLDLEFQLIVDTWTARGLTEATLLIIALQAFGWTPPGT
jgi:hypothetical protein